MATRAQSIRRTSALPVPSRRDRLRSMLADLKMPGALESLDTILQGVDGGSMTAGEAMGDVPSPK